jgi:hypothetical protein
MISMIRAVTKLCIVVAAIGAFLPTATSYAGNVAYVSSSGSGSSCTAALPCSDTTTAISLAGGSGSTAVGRVICLSPVSAPALSGNGIVGNEALEIDCPLGFLNVLDIIGANSTVRLRGVTFVNSGGSSPEITYTGSGTLILENCAFADANGVALDIEPSGPLKLVIRNTRISNNPSGILLKPGQSGSIQATLDHVVITGNNGGGIKTDSTNGVVNLDISDSEISNNAGNGINAVGGTVNANLVNIKNSVIAKNGVAGVQANGGNTAALIATTLLDQNAAGALSIVGAGGIFTYGNNQIVGSQGSNFTSTAALK